MLDMFGSTSRAVELETAIAGMAGQNETGRGAIFTRPAVVEAILDLSGYTTDHPLHKMRLLEPSFGAGDFLFAAARRLWAVYTGAGGAPANAATQLKDSICAVELHDETFARTSGDLHRQLLQWGLSSTDAETLCAAWLVHDDFLLARVTGAYDFVIGNPPYVRQERIPSILLHEYRRRFETMYDRADLYVPFFERGLDLLASDGTLAYICANRWLKNRYGGPLRKKVSEGFWLKYFIDMERADAFHSEVIAYPAITVLQRKPVSRSTSNPTRASVAATATDSALGHVVRTMLGDVPSGDVHHLQLSGSGSAPLLLDDLPRITLVRRLERDLPTLEGAACKVGIGVATGCDKVFIGPADSMPIEADRKLPLVMARDLVGGDIHWGGKVLANPFDADGRLVELDSFPHLKQYLEYHRKTVLGRNVAKRNPSGWYRTIDRVQPGLLQTPKLLVPDIKGQSVFVIDHGQYYPHHNLYFITSREWNLRALQTVLRSSLSLMVISTYCTRMAGGFLRFQAQYLRRIRLPHWRDVNEATRDRLIAASAACDQDELDAPVFELYGLTASEAALVREIAVNARVSKALCP